MFGLLGLMAVLLALISLASYWISWDLQHKEHRTSFAAKTWDDVVDVVERFRGVVRNGGARRRRAALVARAKQEPAKRVISILQRSDPS
jgi:hypothetical protein